MSASRKLRRAAEHVARKAARKAGFPVPAAQTERPSPLLESILEEPGRPLPTLAEISPAPIANRKKVWRAR